MLGIEWGLPQTSARSVRVKSINMPVDFTTCLLSASPPGFDFFQLRDQFASSGSNQINGRISNTPFAPLKPIMCAPGFGPSKSASIPSIDSYASVDSEDAGGDNKAKGMGRKKVSFADELGLALTEVRIMTERSSSPPTLRPEIIDSLTRGAVAGVTESPPLRLNFKQPASDYMFFREKLEKENVSLENVILKDYNLMGTIKVKNIAYEKNVFLRVTYDDWKSSSDIFAKYVPGSGGHSTLDTFSFELSVPTTLSRNRKVKFCVCFMGNGHQYWDNNSGNNYEVLSADWSEKEDHRPLASPVFQLQDDVDWGNYGTWNYHKDDEEPYY